MKRHGVRLANGVLNSRAAVLVIVGVLLLLAGSIVVFFSEQARRIEYAQQHPVASPSAVCPGEIFTYPVNISVSEGQTAVYILEGFCVPGGVCPAKWQAPLRTSEAVDSLGPIFIPDVPRTVPIELPPGDWEFRHCNISNTSNNRPETSCYGVFVTVKPPELCK